MIHYNAKVKALPHLLLPFIHPHAYGPYVQAIPMRVEKNKKMLVSMRSFKDKRSKRLTCHIFMMIIPQHYWLPSNDIFS